MPFRRRSAKLNNRITRAVQVACEPLEQRQLLTALVNGVFTGTNSIFEGQSFFEYRQPNGNATIRISVTGNITAEFIGAHSYGSVTTPTAENPVVDADLQQTPSRVVLSDLVPRTTATSSVWLFSIYVVQADANSAISIAQVPNFATPPVARPMQPFTGSITLNATNGAVASTGGVLIGCATPTTPAETASIPLIYADRKAFGMRPSSAGALYAGLETAPGVNLGKFFVGGAITGIVDVAGSMDSFYAGNLWTGNAQGIGAFDSPGNFNTGLFGVLTPTPKNNFHIGGDIRNILVGNSIGTDTLVGLADLEQPAYKTGVQLSVGGRVGQLLAFNSILGSGTVKNSTDTNNTGAAQREIEVRTAALGDADFSYFDPQYQGFNIAVADAAATGNAISARLNTNDTFGTAQFLGSTRSTTLKDNKAILLRGALTGSNTDYADFYAIPLLAGQTVDIQLRDDFIGQETYHPRLGIFDPDGRLIATDYSDLNDYSRLNKTIRITADRPGAYRVAVGTWGDSNFNFAGTTSDAGEDITFNIDYNYELRITNTGDIALGGMIATGPIGTLDQLSIGFEVLRGDFGELRSGTPAASTLGAPLASANLTGNGVIYSESNPWRIAAGNFRALETVRTTAFNFTTTPVLNRAGSAPDFLVPKGSIGLLRSTGVGTGAQPAIFAINDNVTDPNTGLAYFPTPQSDLGSTRSFLAVGKNIQLVDVAGVLEGTLLANGAIGVIRAAQVGGGLSYNATGVGGSPIYAAAPVWQVNVDGKGNDGTIDLIDVQGNVNAAAIDTGPGGNVRYMHVGGTAYRDTFFGTGGTPDVRALSPGQKLRLTDDSGTEAVFTPIPLDPNPTVPLPQNAPTSFLDPPRLTFELYPIRSGGTVVLRVTVTPVDDTTDNVVRAGGGGLLVETGAHGSAGSFEIGEVARGIPTNVPATTPPTTLPAGSSGNTFTFDPFNRIYTLTALTGAPTDPRDVNFIFRGKSTIDVWNFNDLIANDTISSIVNQTKGELVNIASYGAAGAIGAVVPDIFSIETESLGLARSTTGTAVEGLAFGQVTPTTGGFDNVFPFVTQRKLVRVADVASIKVRRGLGNILAQNIGSIVANSDRKNVSGVFEGIAAPVVSRGATNLTGNILSVEIGEGIAPSGTGFVGFAGLYADGIIDAVKGSAANADIRGNIVAGFQTPFATQQATDPVTGAVLTNPDGTPLLISTPEEAIGSIVLKGGSIIGANIVTNQVVAPATAGTAAPSTEPFSVGRTFVEFADSADKPFYDIGPITLSGSGGVLGSYFSGSDMGALTIKGGFGFISSFIDLQAPGVLDGIVADGYGIRNSFITAGTVHVLDVRGNGKNVPVSSFAGSARFSDKGKFDPYSGEQLSALIDLNKFLGTSKTKTKVSGVTDTGIIEDTRVRVAQDLETVRAQRLRARNAFVLNEDTGKKTRVPFGQSDYPLAFNVGGAIQSMTIRDNIDGLSLTSGSIALLNAGKDVVSSFFTVRGRLKTLSAGSLRSSTTIDVRGSDGQIDTIVTKNDLSSRTITEQGILTMKVGGNVNSKLIRAGGNTKNLTINGSILTGSKVVINGILSKLFIGRDIKAGASLSADSIGQQTINGQVIGDIIIN